MACSIQDIAVRSTEYDAATGITDSIVISGSVSDCESGIVRVRVIDSEGNSLLESGFVDFAFLHDGPWQVEINTNLQCGEDTVRVVVECLRGCDVDETHVVNCCPRLEDVVIDITSPLGPVTEAELAGWDCVAPNETYTFQVSIPTGAGYTYDWIITDGRQDGDPPDRFGSSDNTFPLPLPGDGVKRTILVIIHPPGCNPIYVTRDLRDCGEGVCPKGWEWDEVERRCKRECPEGTVWDPIANECVPSPPPDDGEDCGFLGLRCGFSLCFWIGMLLSMVISGVVFGAFHCYGANAAEQLGEALVNILTTVGFGAAFGGVAWFAYEYWKRCGSCSLGSWLLIATIAGVVGVLIAWYYGYTPSCLGPGIVMVILYVGAAVALLREC